MNLLLQNNDKLTDVCFPLFKINDNSYTGSLNKRLQMEDDTLNTHFTYITYTLTSSNFQSEKNLAEKLKTKQNRQIQETLGISKFKLSSKYG